MVGNLFTTAGRKRVVILVAGRTHNSFKGTHDINQYFFWGGAGILEYERDSVPTGERKRGILCKDFVEKKGHWLWYPKTRDFFGVTGSNLSENLPCLAEIDKTF